MSTLSTLEANSLKGALEALLLVSSDPVSAPALAGALDIAPGECASLLAELKVEYEEANRGFQLREVAGGWRLFTHPAYHDVVEAYVLSWDTQKLSQAALETLAVIAYHQPVTREVVKGIRGVNSDGVIASLVDKGLVRELGRDPQRGQAIIYGTTNAFLEKFGLRSTRDLPDLEQFAPDEQSRQFIRERLSGRSIQSTLEEQAEDLDEERELLDTDVEDVEAVEDLETLVVDVTSEDLHGQRRTRNRRPARLSAHHAPAALFGTRGRGEPSRLRGPDDRWPRDRQRPGRDRAGHQGRCRPRSH